METIKKFMSRFAVEGRLEWIGVAPEKGAPIEELQAVEAEAGRGLAGDRHARGARNSRQVTLVQAELLPLFALWAGVGAVAPEQLRRNLVVAGINLRGLKDKRFRIGSVLLEGDGDCPPCSLMERTIGRGGWNAVRGNGGITARVLESGTLRVGDAVVPVPTGEAADAAERA